MLKKAFIVSSMMLCGLLSNQVFAAGNAEEGKDKSAACAGCHGAEGVSSIPANPNLAGQVPGYIASQLKAFKSGERKNAVMASFASGLSEQDMADLDAYYSSMSPNVTANLTEQDAALAAEGEKIYRGGFADRGISACMSCHGPSGHGIPKNYPRVSAQHKEYLESQLLAYKKGERKGYNNIMSDIAFGLSELQIKQLAAYMAGLN